ncbi:MAG TPA: AAA family ATPase [Gemmatimonadales bacterium]|nr:AAA family ATPase [Gemmatimonadales bacterium]
MPRRPLPASPPNPFEFGRELAAAELVDREAELALVRRSILNRGRLFFTGPRRYGKTSILHAAEELLSEDDVVVLRYNAEAYESLSLLAQALLTGAARRLGGSVEQASAGLRRFFGRLRPEVSYDIDDQRLSVSFGTAARETPELPLLAEVLDGIEGMAADRAAPTAVILDEFQHVVMEGGEAAERQLRAAVQRHRHLAYVFSGSKTRLLAQMTGDSSRAFWKLGERYFLGPIPREAFRPALARGFTGAGFAVDPPALDHLLDRAEDVPYNVQRLASACWETLRVSPHLMLTGELVDQTLVRIVQQENPAYMQLWQSLTKAQKKALKAVIERKGRELLARESLEAHELAASSMQRALQALDARGVIREEEETGRMRYRLEDPFLAAWIAQVQRA